MSAQGKAAAPTDGGESQPAQSTEAQRSQALRSFREKMEGVKERVKAPKFLEFFGSYYNLHIVIQSTQCYSLIHFLILQVSSLLCHAFASHVIVYLIQIKPHCFTIVKLM